MKGIRKGSVKMVSLFEGVSLLLKRREQQTARLLVMKIKQQKNNMRKIKEKWTRATKNPMGTWY